MSEPRGLVDRFGSPLYVYQLDRLDAAHADLRRWLPSPSTLYFSLKANPHPAVAARLIAAGCRAEVSSRGELAIALAAGADPASCLFTGPGKTELDITEGLRSGVTRFSVESLADFQRTARVAAEHRIRVECLVRVNAATAAGSSGLRMSGTSSQFGVDFEQVVRDADSFTAPWAQVVGFHLFSLSNARSEEFLLAELVSNIATAAELAAATGWKARVVDLGGGFASPYAQPGDRPTYPSMAAGLSDALDEHLPGWCDGQVEIAFESGRYLTGDCGSLVASVTEVKTSRNQNYVVLDTGINHLGGLSGLGRMMPVRATPVDGPSGGERRGALVGPLCTPADVLARDTGIDGVAADDVIEIPNVGAYGLTASLLAFLSHQPPVELVREGSTVISASRLTIERIAVSEETL